jgi:hypothetical protein
MKTAANLTGAGAQRGMNMSMRVAAQRIGQCKPGQS